MVRFKNRYITVEIKPHSKGVGAAFELHQIMFYDAIINAVEDLHGDFGVAAVMRGLTTKYCNKYTRVAVIRVRHGPHRLVASALPTISNIGAQTVTLRTLHTGATVKHSHLFLQRYQRNALDKMWATLRTEEERKMMEKAVMDLSVLESLEFGKGYLGSKASAGKEGKD